MSVPTEKKSNYNIPDFNGASVIRPFNPFMLVCLRPDVVPSHNLKVSPSCINLLRKIIDHRSLLAKDFSHLEFRLLNGLCMHWTVIRTHMQAEWLLQDDASAATEVLEGFSKIQYT